MAAFTLSVAGTVSEEGIATFATIASPDAFLNRMSRGDYLTLVAEIDGVIEGVSALKDGHHLAMLFVRPERQKSGIGRQLLRSLIENVTVDTMTVRASLSSVTAYEKYGFELSGDIGESAGLAYQPLELVL
ncbi:GNAT family N-acetyltransferase [Rhodanobacter aciditrophus]|uniref:GNAT family N-acetyltransferase n=1 Tax=Rhodanobacter aciditrophus TaxID=1623218 RepID=A0ABW4B0P7_9GAMM